MDLRDGHTVWTKPVPDTVEAPPLVADGLVVAGCTDGTLVALRATDGAPAWTYVTGGKILGSANLVAGPDGHRLAVIGSYDNKVHAVDLTTGRPAWTFEADGYVNGSPAVAGDRVMVGSCDNFIHILRGRNGRERQRIDAGSYVAASPAAGTNLVVAGTYGGDLIAANPDTGSIFWRFSDTNEAAFFSTPALTADRVYIGRRDSKVYALQRADGTVAWTFAARDNVDGSPVVSGSHVFVGSDDGRFHVLRVGDGREVWSYETGAPLAGSAAIADGFVVIADADGWVHAFRSAP